MEIKLKLGKECPTKGQSLFFPESLSRLPGKKLQPGGGVHRRFPDLYCVRKATQVADSESSSRFA
jgi:hypothetical protein